MSSNSTETHRLPDVGNEKNIKNEASHNSESKKSEKEFESPSSEYVKTKENTILPADDGAKLGAGGISPAGDDVKTEARGESPIGGIARPPEYCESPSSDCSETIENYASQMGGGLDTAKNSVLPIGDDVKASIDNISPTSYDMKMNADGIRRMCDGFVLNMSAVSQTGDCANTAKNSISPSGDDMKASADDVSRNSDDAKLDENAVSDTAICGEKGFVRVFAMVRSFAKGLFSVAYIPLYPVFSSDSVSAQEFCELLEKIALAVRPYLPKNAICVRFDPALEFDSVSRRDAFVGEVKRCAAKEGRSLKKTDVDIQPPDTSIVDIARSEEEILSSMKSKWRYNINLASRKGVVVERVGADVAPTCGDGSKNENACEASASRDEFFEYLFRKVDEFYEVYRITSARDGIAIHSKQYYLDLLKKSAVERFDGKDVPLVWLYVARHEGDVLGSIVTLVTRREGVYLYGASSNVKRNLMPNFLLQWTAMKDARLAGAKCYDLYGIPPTDDEGHPMHGLFLFKTGFGGRNIHRVGTFDVPLKGVYAFCSLAERARAWWHKKFLKKIRGR